MYPWTTFKRHNWYKDGSEDRKKKKTTEKTKPQSKKLIISPSAQVTKHVSPHTVQMSPSSNTSSSSSNASSSSSSKAKPAPQSKKKP